MDLNLSNISSETTAYIVSSAMPFPPLIWWKKAISNNHLVFDLMEHYQKMSFRNRYYLFGSQGQQMLSIPLKGGRNQKRSMKEVVISYDLDWQENHWKTIKTIYQRSPFFDYFASDIQNLFTQKTTLLWEWNLESIITLIRLLGLKLSLFKTEEFHKEYPEYIPDLRKITPQNIAEYNTPISYHQVFNSGSEPKPNCSILDLLFCEGIYSRLLLKK